MTERPSIIDDLLNHVAERLEDPELEREDDVIESLTELSKLPPDELGKLTFKWVTVEVLLNRIARLEAGVK